MEALTSNLGLLTHSSVCIHFEDFPRVPGLFNTRLRDKINKENDTCFKLTTCNPLINLVIN